MAAVENECWAGKVTCWSGYSLSIVACNVAAELRRACPVRSRKMKRLGDKAKESRDRHGKEHFSPGLGHGTAQTAGVVSFRMIMPKRENDWYVL